MIVLREKNYSEDGGNTGAKVLGGLAATAGALYGAKKGLFGNSARMAVGKGFMKAGNAMGSKSLYKSGATDYAKGFVNNANNGIKMAGREGLSKGEIARSTAKYRGDLMKQFKGNSGPANLPAVVK